jgi:hypothetical protein
LGTYPIVSPRFSKKHGAVLTAAEILLTVNGFYYDGRLAFRVRVGVRVRFRVRFRIKVSESLHKE